MMAVALRLPPGFRFHPSDEELVMHYLCRKCASQQIAVPIIKEIDLYKFDPWDLPELALYGEKEWYFFTPRDRKYPNGSRPNRAAGSGYWKATGADKPIGNPKTLGIKKSLVFYTGKTPRGDKTNWIMHEYRLVDVDRPARKKDDNLRLDDWVLCRIHNKRGALEKHIVSDTKVSYSMDIEEEKPEVMPPSTGSADLVHLDTSDSLPGLRTNSRCSGHMASPEFTCHREVRSKPKTEEWPPGFPLNYMDTRSCNKVHDMFDLQQQQKQQGNYQVSSLQDMLMQGLF